MFITHYGLRSKTTIGMGLLAIGLCFVPLFNLLGFEFCFAATCGLTLFHGLESASDLQTATCPTLERWRLSCCKLLGPCTALLVPIMLNGMFVPNCNWIEGTRLFVLLVLGGGIVSSGVAAACSALTLRSSWLFLLIWLLALSGALLRFYFSPQVDLFTLFGGYFPGALYDEVIQQQERMLWSRFEDLSIVTTLILTVSLYRKETSWQTLVSSLIVLLLLLIQSNAMDLRRSRTHIQMRLGAHVKTQHFDIYFPKQWSKNKIERLATEMEFLYAEVTEALDARPKVPFGIYFYATMNQKKRLMGARSTRIAKPWQAELHIDAPRIGSSVTRHELIHLVAADFADGPLSIPHNHFGLPNMALTEGLAEAYSPRDARLSLHEWSAALGKINKRPRIQSLMSADGFYQSSARTAYTVCGSLLLYTQQTHGLESVKQWYRTGSWQQDPPLPVLLENWENFLDTVPLSTEAVEATKAYFDRPSIFKRVCAHELSQLKEDIHKAIRTRQKARIFELIERLLKINPRDRWGRLTYLEQLALDGQFEQANALAHTISNDPHVSQITRSLGKEWTADLKVLENQLEAARATYLELSQVTFDRNIKRRLDVKVASTQRPEMAAALIKLLSFSRDSQQARDRIEELYRLQPDDALVTYLKARHLLNHGHHLRAAGLFRLLKAKKLPQTVRMEVKRIVASLAFNTHCYALADSGYQRYLVEFGDLLTAGERARVEEWRRRSQFFARSTRLNHLACPLEIDNLYIHPHDVDNEE